MSSLVVYFSRKGYAKAIAEKTAAGMGADILRLETTERTAGYPGFWWCGRFGMHRWGMPLRLLDIDVSQYDEVVIVSPIWVFTFCAPVREFAKLACGKVRAARYIFVHFSAPMRYDRAKAGLDALLGVTSRGYESVCCMWGHIFGRKRFGV